MKRFLGLPVGVFLLIGFVSSAEAINIDVAPVQNGVAFVESGKAAANGYDYLGRWNRHQSK